jgi:predicted nucleotidyltransferase
MYYESHKRMMYGQKMFDEFFSGKFNENNISVMIGGSVAKRTADQLSDIDIGVILGKRTDAECILEIFSKNFTLIDRYDVFSGTSYRFVDSFNTTLDVVVVTQHRLKSIVEGFLSLKDYLGDAQDFIWNIKNGIYLSINKEHYELISMINYSDKHKNGTIETALRGVKIEPLKSSIIRNDMVLYYYYINMLHRSVIVITYAVNNVFFMGYKYHKKILSRLDLYPEELFDAIDLCYKKVISPIDIDNIEIRINTFIGDKCKCLR